MKTLLPRRNGSGYVVMCAQWCCMKIGGGAGVRRRLDAVLTVGEVVWSVDCTRFRSCSVVYEHVAGRRDDWAG